MCLTETFVRACVYKCSWMETVSLLCIPAETSSQQSAGGFHIATFRVGVFVCVCVCGCVCV